MYELNNSLLLCVNSIVAIPQEFIRYLFIAAGQ